jgi:hypothetical protein
VGYHAISARRGMGRPRRVRSLRGLRGAGVFETAYGVMDATASYASPIPVAAPTNGCSTWNVLWGNLTGDYSGCIAANQAMIQAVANNAAAYYGGNVAEVTQQEASTQIAQVPGDVYGQLASQSTIPLYVWLGAIGLGILLVVR